MANYLSFLSLLDLFSEMCLGRNENVQTFVSSFYDIKVLGQIYENESYPAEVRTRMIRLIKNLYLDIPKFTKIEIPSEKVIWD